MGEIKFGEIFVPIQSMSFERNFYPAKFLCYTVIIVITVILQPPIKIRQNFLLAYIRMAIPYRTAKFKSAKIWGSTAKFNARQYFRYLRTKTPIVAFRRDPVVRPFPPPPSFRRLCPRIRYRLGVWLSTIYPACIRKK